MNKILSKIAAISFDHPFKFITAWLVLLAALATGAVLNMQPLKTAITIPGTEAERGLTRMNQLFPEAGRGSARAVLVAPDGKTVNDYTANIASLTTELGRIDGVHQAISPFNNPAGISKDRTTAILQIQLDGEYGGVKQTTIDQINTALGAHRTDGLQIESGGDIASRLPGQLLGPGEIVGVGIALLVLLVTFSAFTAAGLPLLIAILGVAASMAGLFSLSKLIDITNTTPALAVMLGLAVGIDYSLFIISKYRHLLAENKSPREAAMKAHEAAGSAVVYAAGTVIIALAALSIVRIPFMTVMGLAGAATVAMVAVAAITLLPALFRLTGMRIFNRKRARAMAAQSASGAAQDRSRREQIWHNWAVSLTKHPVVAIVVPVAIIGLLAAPALSLKLGLPTDQYAPAASTERKAYDAVAASFGPGYNAPLVVVVEGLPPVTPAEMQAARTALEQQFAAQVAAKTAEMQASYQQRLATAQTPQEKAAILAEMQAAQQAGEAQKAEALQKLNLQATEYGKRLHLQQVAQKIEQQTNVEKVLPAAAANDGSYGMLQVIPATAPDAPATKDLIHRLRDPAVQQRLAPGATFSVTGSTALQLDVNAKLAAAIPVYLAVVVGLSIILLTLAFRSAIVPVKATLGYLLSLAAAFGLLVAFFQWGWLGLTDMPSPIVSFIPIIGTGVLFGLAMDYEFFLVSSMRDEFARHGDAKQAVVSGFSHGGKVVTAAAIIMVSVFAGFVTNHDNTIRSIGFALAAGILIDAFLVRMTIVPAVMTLVGRHAWWLPKWLAKHLPKLPSH